MLCATGAFSLCATVPEKNCVLPTNGVWRVRSLSSELKEKILCLDPEKVTERDVREVLGGGPAPQIVNIHGGILPIKRGMNSFAEFLIAMGYPECGVRNFENGTYTYGYYDDGEKIAGVIAWYYEREGLRPMLIGHSQGGIQVIRVLHLLAGEAEKTLAVWNPLTRTKEDRSEITDPLTGKMRPVVGLQVCYASAAASGGLARALPNQWDMNSKLRSIPDSVLEFTGFQKGFDVFGGDYLGYGPANDYHASGNAHVRNVRLPSVGSHWTLPYAEGLSKDQGIKDWIQNYQRGEADQKLWLPAKGRKGAQALWAAELWHDIKKHWVLELQRVICNQ